MAEKWYKFVESFRGYNSETDEPELQEVEVIRISRNKESLNKDKKYRNKDRSDKRYIFAVKAIPQKELEATRNEFNKKQILLEIPRDLEYQYGEKGKAIANSLVDQLRKESYEDVLYFIDLNNIIFEEEYKEHISTYTHICSRHTEVKAVVSFADRRWNCKGNISGDIFRV